MANNTFTNTGNFISSGTARNGELITITYTQESGPLKGKQMTYSTFKSSLSESDLSTIDNLQAGEPIEVQIKASSKLNSQGRPFYNLAGISKASGMPATASRSTSSQKSFKPKASGGGFDNAGARVGGLMHDAVSLAIAQKKPTVEAAEAILRDLLLRIDAVQKEYTEGTLGAPKKAITSASISDDSGDEIDFILDEFNDH